MEYLAFLLLLLSILLFLISARSQKKVGLPGGRVIYSDTRAWGAVPEPLYDQELGLVGKPDYLIEKGNTIIPVEVKSSRLPDAPYDSHIFQIAAYCLLVERLMGKRPPYGIVHYTDRSGASRSFAVDYTSQLESAVIDLIAEIRAAERRKSVSRSHEHQGRCIQCGYNSICEERLV
jgi:CRISPR-associated exonuclease Cas4